MSDRDPSMGVPEPAKPDMRPPDHAESPEERVRRVEAAYSEAAEREEQQLEQVRRRPAEPPPTLEREVVATRGMEWLVIAALLLAAVAAAGFIVFYVVLPDDQLLGLTVGLACAFLAVAAVLTGKRLVPQEKVAEDYHWYGEEELQEDVAAIVHESTEGISRRRLLYGAAGVAGATLGAAALFPLASLGPNVAERVYETPWKRGRRLVKPDGEPLHADEVTETTFFTAFPEGADRDHLGAPLIVVRVRERDLRLAPGREGSAPGGVIAYSKICTHAGCAVSMYREPEYRPTEPSPALVCPCHYSTFDPARGGKVLFGPAGRDLPQLPLQVDDEGVLRAAGGFYDAIGPSYGGIRLKDPSAS